MSTIQVEAYTDKQSQPLIAMLFRQETKQRLTCFVLALLSLAIYPILNQSPDNTTSARILKFGIDNYTPFLSIFVIPYLLYLPFMLATLFVFTFLDKRWLAFTSSFVFCQLVAATVYIAFQTTVPRPEILRSDMFSEAVRLIYAADRPYCCFPSLHVALSVVCGCYWYRRWPAVKYHILALVAAISASTVFIKQHYSPDVISGLGLGLTSYYIGMKYCWMKQEP